MRNVINTPLAGTKMLICNNGLYRYLLRKYENKGDTYWEWVNLSLLKQNLSAGSSIVHNHNTKFFLNLYVTRLFQNSIAGLWIDKRGHDGDNRKQVGYQQLYQVYRQVLSRADGDARSRGILREQSRTGGGVDTQGRGGSSYRGDSRKPGAPGNQADTDGPDVEAKRMSLGHLGVTERRSGSGEDGQWEMIAPGGLTASGLEQPGRLGLSGGQMRRPGRLWSTGMTEFGGGSGVMRYLLRVRPVRTGQADKSGKADEFAEVPAQYEVVSMTPLRREERAVTSSGRERNRSSAHDNTVYRVVPADSGQDGSRRFDPARIKQKAGQAASEGAGGLAARILAEKTIRTWLSTTNMLGAGHPGISSGAGRTAVHSTERPQNGSETGPVSRMADRRAAGTTASRGRASRASGNRAERLANHAAAHAGNYPDSVIGRDGDGSEASRARQGWTDVFHLMHPLIVRMMPGIQERARTARGAEAHAALWTTATAKARTAERERAETQEHGRAQAQEREREQTRTGSGARRRPQEELNRSAEDGVRGRAGETARQVSTQNAGAFAAGQPGQTVYGTDRPGQPGRIPAGTDRPEQLVFGTGGSPVYSAAGSQTIRNFLQSAIMAETMPERNDRALPAILRRFAAEVVPASVRNNVRRDDVGRALSDIGPAAGQPGVRLVYRREAVRAENTLASVADHVRAAAEAMNGEASGKWSRQLHEVHAYQHMEHLIRVLNASEHGRGAVIPYLRRQAQRTGKKTGRLADPAVKEPAAATTAERTSAWRFFRELVYETGSPGELRHIAGQSVDRGALEILRNTYRQLTRESAHQAPDRKDGPDRAVDRNSPYRADSFEMPVLTTARIGRNGGMPESISEAVNRRTVVTDEILRRLRIQITPAEGKPLQGVRPLSSRVQEQPGGARTPGIAGRPVRMAETGQPVGMTADGRTVPGQAIAPREKHTPEYFNETVLVNRQTIQNQTTVEQVRKVSEETYDEALSRMQRMIERTVDVGTKSKHTATLRNITEVVNITDRYIRQNLWRDRGEVVRIRDRISKRLRRIPAEHYDIPNLAHKTPPELLAVEEELLNPKTTETTAQVKVADRVLNDSGQILKAGPQNRSGRIEDEIDVDAIAKRVFDQFERKLSLERTRRGFV